MLQLYGQLQILLYFRMKQYSFSCATLEFGLWWLLGMWSMRHFKIGMCTVFLWPLTLVGPEPIFIDPLQFRSSLRLSLRKMIFEENVFRQNDQSANQISFTSSYSRKVFEHCSLKILFNPLCLHIFKSNQQVTESTEYCCDPYWLLWSRDTLYRGTAIGACVFERI